MLETFTETTKPDNRIDLLEEEKPDELIIGGTCTYVFTVPFLFSEYVKHITFIFKQGLTIILEKTEADCTATELEDLTTSLTLKLSAVETGLFKLTSLDTLVQLRIINKQDEVVYDIPNKLIVRKPLDI